LVRRKTRRNRHARFHDRRGATLGNSYGRHT
jgi:hypothetical protein